MFKNYSDIMTACRDIGKFTISVAVAQDEDVLNAVKVANDNELANAILVGDECKIKPILEKIQFGNAEIIHEPDEQSAAKRAVSLIRDKQADVLMKGLINSSDFMRAVLDSNTGLKKWSLLSHLAVYEIPGQRKLFFMTDGGLNINPDLNDKKGILLNAIDALERMGIDNPKVAILAANEKVNSKMQSTIDAESLVEMRERGEIPTGIIEGPIALDVAISRKAAEHKGIKSYISEDVDLFMVHNIDAGNLLGKTLMYYANAKMAGLVLGAVCPIVLTSRAETSEGKLNSIAMANLMSRTSCSVNHL